MKLKFLVKALAEAIFKTKDKRSGQVAFKTIEEQMKSISEYNSDYKWAVNHDGVMNAFTSRDAARKFCREEGINQKDNLWTYNGTFWLKYNDLRTGLQQMKEER